MTDSLKTTLEDTFPDYRDVGGVRAMSSRASGARCAVVPLAGLALSIGLAATLLEPCLAAAGLPGTGAVLAASMAALFAVLLVIVSVSVAAAIAAMLVPLVAGAALHTACDTPVRRCRMRVVLPAARGLVTVIRSVWRRNGRHGTAGPPGAVASPAAATLAPLPRDSP